ncbi:5-formyltetrahydrofolate cyclo-ligase [Chromobacterium violaceum]|uniref:5-formyltetrahydrofolate cyclo-ligase n=1 Tax=Chromobacterium violaceum TaxID=536 RepID=A0A1R0MT89_CHRVL|nr:5-formyltetrahydrofolate cyclo-ligase [Chromobacterium violaceum]KJH68806.1 5-formyltetrahydrofolate cyclo-ligase [Chromobacterium violaceum]KMN50917.1 5-formyltetrahydrofolate cyclo-ligase [Chromobacterium violaceum]KMN85418.1 5-formyltetrahydrofolate cyclo-ligase [Chromobacterium violaceum]KMN90595.1 5-formyltetrahydrofolate cyclo-ligase [Chromobacterium violaceum]KMO05279.1 5-formyltetrahydrofolate cyclo-ligase [Chromobacterium violaceum]
MTSTSPDIDKPALRRQLRRARMALPPACRAAAARAIARHASRLLKRGKRVGGYLAAGSELDLAEVMNAALWRGAAVYLPQIPKRGRRLWFTRLGAADRWYLHPRYRILEYAGARLRAERLDVVFVPLLGVDRDGYRMGQGGGFYDSTLAFRRRHALSGKPLLVGVAFDCQLVDAVPREAWDVRLDWLLTESGLRRLPLRSARA